MRAEAKPPQLLPEIGPMRRKHVREVLEIERKVYPRPWSAALFFSELSQRKTRYYIVAHVAKRLVAYGGLMVHDTEGHITTVAVTPDLHHLGIGTRLMLDLVGEARARGCRTVGLEVRIANWPAQRLYSWFGFRPVGVRKNYYAETGEDALVMWIEDLQSVEISGRLEKIRSALE